MQIQPQPAARLQCLAARPALGEHGVGQKKMKYLEAEHGAPALAVMRLLKRSLDPQNILNPGKIVTL